jgi:hypothetical protein
LPHLEVRGASVVVNGELYVFGGYGGGLGQLDDFYFNFESGDLGRGASAVSEKQVVVRTMALLISDSERKMFCLGYNGNSWLNDLWEFDESKRWTFRVVGSGFAGSADPEAEIMW